MTKEHWWQGRWVNGEELETLSLEFGDCLAKLQSEIFPYHGLLAACDGMRAELNAKGEMYNHLRDILVEAGNPSQEVEATLEDVAEFLHSRNLMTKIKRELGGSQPLSAPRLEYETQVFERWQPLGLLCHVAPTNAMAVGILSAIEGLLVGNANFVKCSASDSLFAQKFFDYLSRFDPSERLRNYVFVARLSSSRQDLLGAFFGQADAVVAWGGEDTINSVRQLCPPLARFIDWGPKISFAYLARSHWLDGIEAVEALCEEICLLDQQACSSPQTVFLEDASEDELREFGRRLGEAFDSRGVGRKPDAQAQAEITMVSEVAKLSSLIEGGTVLEAEDRSWRVLVDPNPGLAASPLYRSVWLKPARRTEIGAQLRPLRSYLQTAGIAASSNDLIDISRQLVSAGVDRVTTLGKMQGSYLGEPHDGRYALQLYARRVSYQLDESFDSVARLDDFEQNTVKRSSKVPIMTKEDFQGQSVDPAYAQLLFKSGGSSGEPKLSAFTYADYHEQMRAAAGGLVAAGLNPARDCCMNLFFGGGLYGGFVSFFTILEHLKARQLPMASAEDYDFVCDMIVRNRVNVLLGMPSYLIALFEQKRSELKNYGGIEKIFYGGEHFHTTLQDQFKRDFGVKIISSASYGSVDAGPLGYQCEYSKGAVHHVQSSLQELEILELEADRPVDCGEIGRLIFSSKVRQGQSLQRYEIGDLGRWVSGACGCGRSAPRFELMGRHGDVCRVGTTFVNYAKLCRILAETMNYAHEVQLDIPSDRELIVKISDGHGMKAETARTAILDNYKDVKEVVEEGILELRLEITPPDSFAYTPGSGKLRHILDMRT